ncbi:hypothetical protein [Microbacterium pygmaeum]|uniref:Uncharacterized protein n=1 Tax=Microbacterium pygmaeum TaxID=370764 RepID=A0A1G7WTZ1_9MICO|nr:hypothetical protein [Microbacterium pygmaeum]SDG75401.1 hypothetical protein SAMN04489810_1195 [Microbacterium pygmaeum]
MITNEYLPEAAINADPAGGWESGEVADGETAERNADAAGSSGLTESGLPPLTPDGADATADTNSEGVEGAKADADPDLIADDDLDAEDPA